ncbi:MAG: hypothetical protein QME81_04535 [bacterium]|nr:hypothetical protein [bacterium]
MRRLVNFFFGDLQTSALRASSLLTVFIFIFGLVLGMAEQLQAKPSRYTIDDVMDKLIEMDKRLTVVEKQIETINARIDNLSDNLNARIDNLSADLNARIDDTNTTMRWLFGFLGSLFLGILALTFAIYRNTANLSKTEAEKPAKALARVLGILKSLEEEVKETARRERVLEEKLQAAGVI